MCLSGSTIVETLCVLISNLFTLIHRIAVTHQIRFVQSKQVAQREFLTLEITNIAVEDVKKHNFVKGWLLF